MISGPLSYRVLREAGPSAIARAIFMIEAKSMKKWRPRQYPKLRGLWWLHIYTNNKKGKINWGKCLGGPVASYGPAAYASVGSTLQDRKVVWVVWVWVGIIHSREKWLRFPAVLGVRELTKRLEIGPKRKSTNLYFCSWSTINDTLDIKTYKTIFFSFIFFVTWLWVTFS